MTECCHAISQAITLNALCWPNSVGKAFLAVEMFVSEITLGDLWLVFKTGIAMNV